MADELTIHIGLPPKVLSPNNRQHWRRRMVATSGYRKEAWAQAKIAVQKAGWRDEDPVVISVVYAAHRATYGYHALDIQNAMAALKPAVDGLVDGGVVKNDSKHWVSWDKFDLYTTKREITRLFDGRVGVWFTVRKA